MSDGHAILVIGLAYGDCGKGSIVDFLARRHQAHTVVRFNGGPQAGHNVVTADGRHHTFSQFGSGTFVSGVRTLLSRFMLIEPYALYNEAQHLAEVGITDAFERLLIDSRCPVISPAHQAANRLRELARGPAAHGTCGMGVGELMRDLLERPAQVLRAGELADAKTVRARMAAACAHQRDALREVIRQLRDDDRALDSIQTLMDSSWIEVAVDSCAELACQAAILPDAEVRAILLGGGAVVFEGAQGVLLDEDFGVAPHTTWSHTTFRNAEALLNEAGFDSRRTRVGVVRTYFTRHGAGPFPTEDAGVCHVLAEPHNDDRGWQGRFRTGVFDAVSARYSLMACGGVNCIALTHLDALARLPQRICGAYDVGGSSPLRQAGSAASYGQAMRCGKPVYNEWRGDTPDEFVRVVEREMNAVVGIGSCGPTAEDKFVRGQGL